MPPKRSSLKIKPKTPSTSNQIVLLSACLSGIESRYDGHHKLRRGLLLKLGECPILPVCPEQLGGLPTPRSRAQIIRGNGSDVLKGKARVVNAQGQDVTVQFIKGAKETLKIVRLNKIKRVFLKEGSPSCGAKRCIRREKESGPGVTTALLLKEGIDVIGVE
jgi:uncharacterized protein YbbK (DUF523 family)